MFRYVELRHLFHEKSGKSLERNHGVSDDDAAGCIEAGAGFEESVGSGTTAWGLQRSFGTPSADR